MDKEPITVKGLENLKSELEDSKAKQIEKLIKDYENEVKQFNEIRKKKTDQFNSFSSTLLILFAVIMSTVGVVLGLLITKQPFGIVMSGIGVISLAGIVVNNNIVLIDTFDRLIKKTNDARDAILMTGAQRLRPVLLTTTTTVLGLLPMALKLNIDFVNFEYSYNSPDTQWWVDLSRAIVFGLLFSTLLTLLVTPSALMLKSKYLTNSSKKFDKIGKQTQ